MVKYSWKNLSWQIFRKLQDLKDKPADMTRICESFRAGWQEVKKNGDEKEKSSLAIFMKSMNLDTEILPDNPIH